MAQNTRSRHASEQQAEAGNNAPDQRVEHPDVQGEAERERKWIKLRDNARAIAGVYEVFADRTSQMIEDRRSHSEKGLEAESACLQRLLDTLDEVGNSTERFADIFLGLLEMHAGGATNGVNDDSNGLLKLSARVGAVLSMREQSQNNQETTR